MDEEWKKNTLPALIAGYDEKDIVNADNILPDKTFVVIGDSCHVGKMSKPRLSVLLIL